MTPITLTTALSAPGSRKIMVDTTQVAPHSTDSDDTGRENECFRDDSYYHSTVHGDAEDEGKYECFNREFQFLW